MIPRGYVSLQTLFSKVADREAEGGDKIAAANIAAAQLHQRLAAGELQSYRCNQAGAPISVPVAEWHVDRADFTHGLLGRAYVDVAIMEGAANGLAPARQSGAKIETRGAKGFDRSQLCAAVALAVYEGGGLTTQVETIDKIAEAFEQLYGRDNAPSRQTLQPIANAVIRALRPGREAANN
jgi:hypothetical protein